MTKTALPPMHPGELLREEILPALDLPVADIAHRLGVSDTTLDDVLSEKSRVTAEMALRLGKLFGNGPNLWINLQTQYDIMVAEKEIGKDLAHIETIRAA